MPKSSAAAIALIHRFEGIDYPWVWPGGASGITIPYGYDLGYERTFEKDWSGLLDVEIIRKLRPAVGVKGGQAHAMAPTLRGLKIPLEAAAQVFNNVVIPREEALVAKVFPGSDTLPGDAFGALVSLIFNRGSLIDRSDRRKEMLAIYGLFRKGPPYDLAQIADLVDAQKRLWPDNTRSDGDLHDRRIAEASLIRHAA